MSTMDRVIGIPGVRTPTVIRRLSILGLVAGAVAVYIGVVDPSRETLLHRMMAIVVGGGAAAIYGLVLREMRVAWDAVPRDRRIMCGAAAGLPGALLAVGLAIAAFFVLIFGIALVIVVGALVIWGGTGSSGSGGTAIDRILHAKFVGDRRVGPGFVGDDRVTQGGGDVWIGDERVTGTPGHHFVGDKPVTEGREIFVGNERVIE
jgi:hypothetical protein